MPTRSDISVVTIDASAGAAFFMRARSSLGAAWLAQNFPTDLARDLDARDCLRLMVAARRAGLAVTSTAT